MDIDRRISFLRADALGLGIVLSGAIDSLFTVEPAWPRLDNSVPA
jgi:hypothetical protein